MNLGLAELAILLACALLSLTMVGAGIALALRLTRHERP